MRISICPSQKTGIAKLASEKTVTELSRKEFGLRDDMTPKITPKIADRTYWLPIRRSVAGNRSIIRLKTVALDTKEFIRKREARPGDVMRHFGDNSKFKELYGFTPEIRIEEGLLNTIEWFRNLPFSPEELLSEELEINWKRADASR